MPAARALVVVVLLLSYGAVGARQPAVRSSVPLPAPAAELAEALGLPIADRSRIVLDIIRLAFDTPDGVDPKDGQLRARLNAMLQTAEPGETAPLPLDPSIWRDTILKRDVPDAGLFSAILSDRRTALLYHGLASLDDETLGWLGPEHEVIEHLLRHAGVFARGADSLRIKAGRVVVPGGADADPVWERVIGAPPANPAAFIRRLFGAAEGRLAFFYETIASLDEPRRRFALAAGRPASVRMDHVRALARVFERSFGELRPDDRPFGRHPMDPALTLATVTVQPDGQLAGPAEKLLWEMVLRSDDGDGSQFAEVRADSVRNRKDTAPIDAAWLTARIHEAGPILARRKLDTFLFAQRVFRDLASAPVPATATALRGMLAFPALMLTLERAGVTSPQLLATAAMRADALNAIGDAARRKESIRLFQASVGIIDRVAVAGGLSPPEATARLTSLFALDLSKADAGRQIGNWLRTDLLPAITVTGADELPESAILASIAGANKPEIKSPVLEWEGQKYRVSPQLAELNRLRRVRARQGGASLDAVITSAGSTTTNGGNAARRDPGGASSLADVLTSILYAAHLGDPDSRLLAADNVALRHDLALDLGSGMRQLSPWRFPVEGFGEAEGWRLIGSLLGLDVALARHRLRTLDLTTMPPAPRLTSSERQNAALTSALMRPQRLTDDLRNEIAAAIKRGRARFAALSTDRDELERVARDAGLSGWRREALAWALRNDPERAAGHISHAELMWLGSPRVPEGTSLDDWGATAFPLTGCLCLEMPDRGPWEFLGGRPSVGLFASRGADVTLMIAEEFAELQLPAALIPGVLAFAMQDALYATQPAYFDDWSEFGRATRTISRERLIDYVAALTAGGPLMPMKPGDPD